MRQIKVLAVIAGVLACAAAQAGDVYKYVDERGNTMYTDKPIPGAVRVSASAQRPQEVSERSYAAQQKDTNTQLNASNQRIADAQNNSRVAETVAKDLKATQVERCKKAREAYEGAINARRLYREKEGGQREYLNDAELAQNRVEALKQAESICGPNG
jgi:hypothetical protein